MLKLTDCILLYGAQRLLMLDDDSLILLDVMKIVLLHVLSYNDNPLIRLIIFGFVMTPTGIEPATFQFVAQHLNHCATAVPELRRSK